MAPVTGSSKRRSGGGRKSHEKGAEFRRGIIMSLFSRLFRKTPVAVEKVVTWPNHPTWSALKNEVSLQTEDGPRFLWTIPCGDLALPSGRLVACDPFVFLRPRDNPYVPVPMGRFPVFVTLADLGPNPDKSYAREAYASIIFASEKEAYRKAIALAKDGEGRPELEEENFVRFGVDAGHRLFRR